MATAHSTRETTSSHSNHGMADPRYGASVLRRIQALSGAVLARSPLRGAALTQVPYIVPGLPRVVDGLDRASARLRRLRSLAQLDQALPCAPGEEHIACALCSGTRRRIRFRPGRDDEAGAWSYAVARCATCGLHARAPAIKPLNVPDLYIADGYADFLEGDYGRGRRRRYKQTLDAFAPHLSPHDGSRVLDFGCGTGIFMGLAESLGYEVYGIDLSPAAAAVAQKRFGTDRVTLGAIGDMDTQSFDLITMWSVLAHIADPREQLTELFDLLRPGGSLLILTVNAESLQRKTFRSHWNGFTPNHLIFWDETTLDRMLTEIGFSTIGFAPAYGVGIESGRSKLSPTHQRRYRRTVETYGAGNMLRALATK